MALWAWARAVPFVLGDNAWDELPHVKRFLDQVSARPAAARAEALADAHTFKAEMDQAAMAAMMTRTTSSPCRPRCGVTSPHACT